MWDELLANCEQTKAICAKETTRMMAYLETVKAMPKPVAAILPVLEDHLPSLTQLAGLINAVIDRSENASKRSKKLEISAGLYLVQAKKLFQEIPASKRAYDERTWDVWCDKYLTVHRRRADQLIAFVEGRANEDQVREADRERKRLEKEIKRKQELESAGIPADEDDIEAEIDPDPDTRRLAFLLRADQARLFAKYTGPVDEDVLRIAREAAAAWTQLVQQLTMEVGI